MTMFLIQSAILIAIAFVAGCIIGCLLRRMFAVEAVVPATVATQTSTLPQIGTPVPVTANSADVAPTPLIASPVVAKKPKSVPRPKTATKSEVAVEPAPPTKSKARSRSAPNQKVPEAVVPTGSKPANIKPAASKPVSASSKKPMAAKLAKPVAGKPDNLALIDGIGSVIEKKLHGLGVFHFEQIAKWTKAEAEEASKAVGFPGRAIRENWMKEAAIFMKGGTTGHARKSEAGTIATSRKSTAAEKGRKK